MMFRNKFCVKHEIHVYNSPFFLLTLGPFPSPPSILLTICQHQLQLKHLLKAATQMGGCPMDPRRTLVTLQGLFMWKEMHIHAWVSWDCLPTIYVGFKVSAWLWQYIFFWKQQQRCPLFCTFSPWNQKASTVYTPPLRLPSWDAGKKEWLLRQGPNHPPKPTVIHLFDVRLSPSLSLNGPEKSKCSVLSD